MPTRLAELVALADLECSENPAGYRMFRQLAPGSWSSSVGPVEYERLYKAEVLDKLDPAVVVAQLEELAAGRIAVMVCFEKPDGVSWCHRAMAASWIHDLTDQSVPEIGFEHLSQSEHPLLPGSATRYAATSRSIEVATAQTAFPATPPAKCPCRRSAGSIGAGRMRS